MKTPTEQSTGVKVDFEVVDTDTNTVTSGTIKFGGENVEGVTANFDAAFPQPKFKIRKFSAILVFGEVDLICG